MGVPTGRQQEQDKPPTEAVREFGRVKDLATLAVLGRASRAGGPGPLHCPLEHPLGTPCCWHLTQPGRTFLAPKPALSSMRIMARCPTPNCERP